MDSREFEKIVDRMRDGIYRLARSMLGCGAEADDAVHDVLERMWRRAGELSGHGNVEALVWTATRNHCVDRLRRRRVRAAGADAGDRGWEPSHEMEMREMHSAVEAAIAELPMKQRMVIHLRDIEGMEFDEIAAATSIDESAVRVNLSRARKAVRERVTKMMNYGL
jgi:RNA polymerase sigma-70 factor (ECF subfamily)